MKVMVRNFEKEKKKNKKTKSARGNKKKDLWREIFKKRPQ
jgi:hypothetical protein